MKNTYYSACVLNKDDESQCVFQALKLIGTILNSRYSKEDSKALLICTRSAWNKAIESAGTDIASSFYSNKSNESTQNSSYSQSYSTEFPYNLLKDCFGGKLTKVNANYHCSEGKSQDGEDSASVYCGSDPDIFGDHEEKSQAQSAQPDSGANGHGDGDNASHSVNSMKRLLIRFVDDLPSRKIVDGRLKSCAPEDEERSCFWNYIQAANEIAIHGGAVDYVVVASLSEIVMRAIPNYLREGPDEGAHPFTSSETKQGRARHYQQKPVSMYTMALAITTNAVSSRIKGLQHISDCDSRLLPRLALVESLPPQEEDAAKFIKFISARFGSTHLLK